MKLIDRYVHEVGRRLPKKMRGDVELEIRSTIEDTLEGYAAKQGSDVNEEMVVTVLQEFGNPEKVAASYRPGKQYLVGPGLFPIFKIVATVYFAAITVLFIIGVVAGSNETATIATRLVNLIGEYWGTITGGLGSIVIIFTILERVLPPVEWENEEEEWNPQDLPAIDDPTRVNRFELIAGVVFSAFLIILFNFFPEKVGIILIHDGIVEFVPLLGKGYTTYLPWLNLWWVLSVVLNVIVLRQGHWQMWTRWAEWGVNVLSLLVLYLLFTSTDFLAFNPVWTPEFDIIGQDLAREMVPFFSWIMKMVIGIVMIVVSVEVVTQFYKLVFRRSDWQPKVIKLS